MPFQVISSYCNVHSPASFARGPVIIQGTGKQLFIAREKLFLNDQKNENPDLSWEPLTEGQLASLNSSKFTTPITPAIPYRPFLVAWVFTPASMFPIADVMARVSELDPEATLHLDPSGNYIIVLDESKTLFLRLELHAMATASCWEKLNKKDFEQARLWSLQALCLSNAPLEEDFILVILAHNLAGLVAKSLVFVQLAANNFKTEAYQRIFDACASYPEF